jgi:hypothetical protein
MLPKIFFYIHNTEDLDLIVSSYELTGISFFFLSRLIRYRLMTIFTLLGGLVAFYFTNSIISEKIPIQKRNIIFGLVFIGTAISLFLFSPELNDIIELFGFLCIAIIVYLVYFRFLTTTYAISKRPDIDAEFRPKFQALALMSLFVILAVVSIFLSVIEYILFDLSYGIFYYLTMIFLLLMLIYSIKGFISQQEKK